MNINSFDRSVKSWQFLGMIHVISFNSTGVGVHNSTCKCCKNELWSSLESCSQYFFNKNFMVSYGPFFSHLNILCMDTWMEPLTLTSTAQQSFLCYDHSFDMGGSSICISSSSLVEQSSQINSPIWVCWHFQEQTENTSHGRNIFRVKEHLFRTFNLVSALSILWMEMSARYKYLHYYYDSLHGWAAELSNWAEPNTIVWACMNGWSRD